MDSLARLIDADAVRRLVDRDPTLFSSDVDLRQPIMQRLGWTDLAERAESRLTLVENLAAAVAQEGATDVVLLGMGGSSLAPLVMERVIGSPPGAPTLHVLDTTSPTAVTALRDSLTRSTTYFILSSKSGTTIEPLSLYAIFRAWMEEEMERPAAGKHFIAITDPGSPLEEMRAREFMRVALSAPPTVGGRFSAMSVFGLAPAAMCGIDVRRMVELAREMEDFCHAPAEDNPAAALAAWIVDSHAMGKDKLTLATSRRYEAFGLWVEQLVAESTGKQGTGVIPVLDYEPTTPTGYGQDRALLVLRESQDTALARFAETARAEGHPVHELMLDDPLGIGGEFVRWEHAVALAGHLMGINPFDEPNVAKAKAATNAVLAGTAHVPPANADLNGVWTTYVGSLEGAAAPHDLPTSLAPLVASIRPGDYLGVLAYLPTESPAVSVLKHALEKLSSRLKVAVCFETGPRYLHSTGQLHKGGPDSGAFLLITTREHANLAIPGSTFTLAQLFRAQAEGDLVTLAAAGRRTMRLDLPGNDLHAIKAVAEAFITALS
ncbi:MAG: glucose-6-phosphate isomerase [Coriobacteriia bacterium]|nr:glucose-6-phosphate isomerase [Coriobacteriia bacterium]